MGNYTIVAACIGAVAMIVAAMISKPPSPSDSTFTTSMEPSSLTCSEICQARGADCVSARVPSQGAVSRAAASQAREVALRSKQCVCRKG